MNATARCTAAGVSLRRCWAFRRLGCACSVFFDQVGALAQTGLALLLGPGAALWLRRGRMKQSPGGCACRSAGGGGHRAAGRSGRARLAGRRRCGTGRSLAGAAHGGAGPGQHRRRLSGRAEIRTLAFALLGSAFGYRWRYSHRILARGAAAVCLCTGRCASVAGSLPPQGLLAAGGLMFFDPTELTILLGDASLAAARPQALAIGLGWLTGGLASGARKLLGGREWTPPGRPLRRRLAWLAVTALYLRSGIAASADDRLFVIPKDQADISWHLASLPALGTNACAQSACRLTAHANASQAGLRQTLDTLRVGYTPYYLAECAGSGRSA